MMPHATRRPERPASAPSTPRPSFWPREHGAYAMVAFPMLTAILVGRPGPAALLLVLASIAAFLAHEPLTVWLGGRGGRARTAHGAAARRRTLVLALFALATGVAGLVLAPPAARLAALLPGVLAVLWVPAVLTRREKTLLGEALVALTLSAALIPVAMAAGAGLRVSLIGALTWAAIFLIGTLTVHAIISAAKKKAERRWVRIAAPIACLATAALAIVLWTLGSVPPLAALAPMAAALVGFVFSSFQIHPRHLRTLGWSLVGSDVAALLLLVLGLR